MKPSFPPMHRGRYLLFLLFTLLLLPLLPGGPVRVLAAPLAPAGMVRLGGHVPAQAMARALPLGRVAPSQAVALTLTLPLRDQGGLESFLASLYDPTDPLYHHYLVPEEFARRYSPTQQSYDAVAAFARSRGLSVTRTSPNRLVMSVSGSAAAVESAFAVHLGLYRGADGRIFHAPDADPAVPAALIGRLAGIVGLDNSVLMKPLSHRGSPRHATLKPVSKHWTLKQAADGPAEIGSDPHGGGLTPSDIKAAYSVDKTPLTGAGQVMGLYELDGYLPSDIATYTSTYSLQAVPLTNILIDGFDGSAGGSKDEVTLDIEVMNALAPGASKILVYEAQNGGPGVVDLYHKIADDNLAKEISVSWGVAESQDSADEKNSENAAFMQMATQGQSVFIASGDSGAYADNVSIGVGDPASQPYITSVGGTALATNGPGGSYASETTWGSPSPIGAGTNGTKTGGGGGGISIIWPLPDYQKGVGQSSTLRNVPDVSLDADPNNSGYSIYTGGNWVIYGGTSVAAPLWAAFTALANQQRAKNGDKLIGFANPLIYTIGKGANYNSGFHDIADNSTNFYYHATTGYDNATGWGSFNGAGLLPLFAPSPGTIGKFLASLAITPAEVVGGLTATGTVTLVNPAPAAGAVVTVTSTDAVVAPVPPTVTVPAGQISVDFPINTTATKGTSVTVTATYQGDTQKMSLKVDPAPVVIVPASVSFSPPSVSGGSTSQGTVTLIGPAPQGGLVVTLTSSDLSVPVPASVSVPAGSTTVGFTVTTVPVAQVVTATVTASANGGTASGTLTVLAPELERVLLTPATLPGGQTVTGTLTLTLPASAGGGIIALSSNNPAAAAVPASATIPAGGTTTTFTITTKAVPTTAIVTISATFAGLTQKAKLEVRAARLTAISVAPASLTGGTPAVGTVTLDSPVAVAAGLVIALSSSDPSGKLPATVTVPLGATTATFPLTTSVVAAPVSDTLTASLDGFNKTAVLSVQPIQVTNLTLAPAAVIAGVPSVGTVTVNAPAPPGGLLVTLTQTGAGEILPASATVPAGATSVTFSIGTPLAGTVTIAAIVGGQTRTASLTVTTAVGTSFPAGLNMLSVPYDYSGQPLDALFGYAGVRMATEDAAAGQYAFTPIAPADALRLGRSYFVNLPKAVTLTSVGTPADPTADFAIALPAGWNMIGDPFLVPISLGATHVASAAGVLSFSAAVSATPLLVSSLLYSFSPTAGGGKGGYVPLAPTGSLQPGSGYWIYAYSACSLVIPHPGQ